MDFFTPYMDRITALCKAHKVASLYAFGSTVKGNMDAQSDVDLLLDLPLEDPYEFVEHYEALEDGFMHLFNRPVDLVSKRTIRNPYRLQLIEQHQLKLYGA